MLIAFMKATLRGESCTKTEWADYSLAEKPKVGELQMDWLRSEDLKEEKNETAPIVIIAVHSPCRSQEVTRSTIGYAANEPRIS